MIKFHPQCTSNDSPKECYLFSYATSSFSSSIPRLLNHSSFLSTLWFTQRSTAIWFTNFYFSSSCKNIVDMWMKVKSTFDCSWNLKQFQKIMAMRVVRRGWKWISEESQGRERSYNEWACRHRKLLQHKNKKIKNKMRENVGDDFVGISTACSFLSKLATLNLHRWPRKRAIAFPPKWAVEWAIDVDWIRCSTEGNLWKIRLK